jgi:hypothetical protein
MRKSSVLGFCLTVNLHRLSNEETRKDAAKAPPGFKSIEIPTFSGIADLDGIMLEVQQYSGAAV